ncbi:MAG: TonB-dependent receptor [Hymenobacter sp.]
MYDDYRERLSDHRVTNTDNQATIDARELRLRTERVPGAFAEYTYNNTRNLTAVLSLRTDYHNLYGWQVTPRFNLKYDLRPATSLRVSAGRGFRVAQPHCRQRGHAGQRPAVLHRGQYPARSGLEYGRLAHAVFPAAGPAGYAGRRTTTPRFSKTSWWPICTRFPS